MSETVNEEISNATAEAPKAPTHADMFFRYISALAQAAGVQAFTMAVAVPKDDGTSAVMGFSAGAAGTSVEWQEETAKLLGEQATTAAQNIIQPPKPVEAVGTPAEVV